MIHRILIVARTPTKDFTKQQFLPKYRAMLAKFNEVQKLMNYEDLSKDQVADIVSAKPSG